VGFLESRQTRKSGKAVFLEEYEAFWTDLLPIRISDARQIRTPVDAASCRILGKERQDAAATPPCEVNDSISRFFRGFARSRHPAMAYGSRTLIFLGLKSQKFHFF
jgi:hypothetical protein